MRSQIKERAYKQGRGNGAVLDNKTYELLQRISTIVEPPNDREDGPNPVIDKGLYLDEASKELRYYDVEQDKWISVFEDYFRVTNEMLNTHPSDNPVVGQLWLDNDFLYYFNGTDWAPVKSIQQDGDLINLALFDDFLLMSPMVSTGDTVAGDTDKKQFLVPRVGTGKMFVEGLLSEEYEVQNKVTVQFDTNKTPEALTSWVHVNPGKLTNIKRQLFLINKESHFVPVNAQHTEFYAFRYESLGGKLLKPHVDYTPKLDGILLDEVKAVSYDYILAVTYEFGWVKTNGSVNLIDSLAPNAYSSVGISGGVSVFVDGYQLDENQYSYNPVSDYLEILDKDFLEEDQEVMVLSNFELMESGIIRAQFRHDYAVIRLRNQYENPLLFVNGEALHESSDGGEFIYDREQGRILVTGAHTGMGYTVVDLKTPAMGGQPSYDALISAGTVGKNSKIGIAENTSIENIVLFIDGTAVPPEQLMIEEIDNNKYLTVSEDSEGLLLPDMRYILLDDRYRRLYTLADKKEIAHINGVDDVMIYEDRLLRLTQEFLLTENLDDVIALDSKVIGEYQSDGSIVFKKYNAGIGEWIEVSNMDRDYIHRVTTYCVKTPSTIVFNKPEEAVDVRIYAYSFTATAQHPLIVGRFPSMPTPDLVESISRDEAQNYAGQDTFYFESRITYPPNKNALQVFVDGVRIYDVEEFPMGNGFKLPSKVVGTVSYIIEKPIPGETRTCTREVLTHEDALDGYNIYKTKEPLYPGNLTVYASGLRQPKENYVILDHHTIMFKDNEKRLIGYGTYPEMDVRTPDGSLSQINISTPDTILIENRKTRIRNEDSIVFDKWEDGVSIDIDSTGLPRDILDAKDHLLFFIDGRFLGLQWNKEDYEILHGIGKIVIYDALYKLSIEENPLLTLLSHDASLLEEYTRTTGKSLEDFDHQHVLTIEWR